MQQRFSLVLDIGKTNIKVHVLDEHMSSKFVATQKNTVIRGQPYPHFDVDNTWAWLINTFKLLASKFDISTVVVSTHGATAVLLDTNQANGLAMPVLDYEFSELEKINTEYDQIRPPYSESFSPGLPAGLNLGRQLYWLQSKFQDEFDKASAIVLYPQYWVWRLTGKLVSERTSLGCHTALWAPTRTTFTSFAMQQGWNKLIPSLAHPWESAGELLPEICRLTKLSRGCKVLTGIHDSSASFLRFKSLYRHSNYCVMSTGTWVIGMAPGGDSSALNKHQDMLANVDAEGTLLRCIRFMGGREYAAICDRLGRQTKANLDRDRVQSLIDQDIYALPNFSDGSGPFGIMQPRIIGTTEDGAALATLYCALVMDYCADLLDAKGDIIITGSFVQNPVLCAIFTQLRSTQSVKVSRDTSGTVRGAAMLANWGGKAEVKLEQVLSARLQDLAKYKKRWLNHILSQPEAETVIDDLVTPAL